MFFSAEEKVSLGDVSMLDVKGEGAIHMEMTLQDDTKKECTPNSVLYIPNLAYNLVSVSSHRCRQNS